MADLVSPFAEVARRPVPPLPGAVPQVTLAPLRIHPAWEVQSFDRSADAGPALARALKLKPAGIGQCVGSKGKRMICADTGRWIVHADAELPGLREAAGPACSVVDITHARAGFRLAGTAAKVLRKLVKLDLSDDRFAVGRAAELQLHHLGVMLIRVAPDAFDIYALSSFAEDVWDAVADASIEFGYRIEAEQGF